MGYSLTEKEDPENYCRLDRLNHSNILDASEKAHRFTFTFVLSLLSIETLT